MDYYEELGISRTASTEEIRQSYKRLARLLHPDHCEPPLRQSAELQMTRLNRILETLVNPAERTQYDATLAGANAPDIPVPQWFWPACGTALLVALLFVFTHLSSSPEPRTVAAAPSPAKAPAPVKQVARSSRALRTAVVEAPHRDIPIEPAVSPEPPSARIEAPRFPEPIAAPVIAPPAAPTVAGDWLFVPSRSTVDKNLYPPDYIEMRVTERGGAVRGRYRARYRVADRAISPNVSFEFTGRGATLGWHGSGGSKGEVTLRLLSSGAIEVNWVATEMGAELGLISGTATLVRKLD